MLFPESLYTMNARLKEGVAPAPLISSFGDGAIAMTVEAGYTVPAEFDFILTNICLTADSIADTIIDTSIFVEVPGGVPWVSAVLNNRYAVPGTAERESWSGSIWIASGLSLKASVLFSGATNMNILLCGFQGILVPMLGSWRSS